jgi:hypothetical protein
MWAVAGVDISMAANGMAVPYVGPWVVAGVYISMAWLAGMWGVPGIEISMTG